MRWVKNRLRRAAPDAGVTLVELLVSALVFSLVMGIITTAIVTMSGIQNRDNAQASDFDAGRNVISRLDQNLRYANAITTPVTGSSGASYVAYETGNTTSTGQTQTCTQWRYLPSAGSLAFRSWTVPTTSGATVTPTSWVTVVAKGVSQVGTTPVWQLNPTSGDVAGPATTMTTKETLGVEFKVSLGAPPRSQNFLVSITAANTTTSTPPASTCQEVGTP